MVNTETERRNKSRLWRFDGVRGKRISKRLSRKHIRRESKRLIAYESERTERVNNN